jgi:ATP-dependent RNA helicase SUPV3L1/SUV3
VFWVIGVALRADEVHLCGEPSAINVVQRLCAQTNEQLEIREYDRLSPLQIASKSLQGNFKNLQRGDCLVTFSRNDIFWYQQEIKRSAGLNCAVIYGALPPGNYPAANHNV